MTESMKGAKVRHLRRKFVESLLRSFSKEELLEFHEHWTYDTGMNGNSLYQEFSRYVAVAEPDLFRDAPRGLKKGDTVYVKGGNCSCSSCKSLKNTVATVYSTGNEEKALRPTPLGVFANGPTPPLVRLTTPSGGYTSCCYNEAELELVGSSRFSNVRITPIRTPESGWGIDTPDETEALVRLNVMAKHVGHIAPPTAVEKELDRTEAKIESACKSAEQKVAALSPTAPTTENKCLSVHHIVKERIDGLQHHVCEIMGGRIDSLQREVEWLLARVYFLIAWATLASVIAFGAALMLWND